MSGFLALLRRDLMLALRAGGGAISGAIFFLLIGVVFAFAAGPDPVFLSRLAAPVLWSAALLTTLATLERIFQADAEDGSLDILVETVDPLEIAFLAKAAAHWVITAVPLALAALPLALMLGLPERQFGPLLLSLLLGTPALSLIGALGSALAASLRRAGVLIAILVAPLYLPTLIFAAEAAQGGPRAGAALMFLAATSMFALIVAPPAGAAAMRAALD